MKKTITIPAFIDFSGVISYYSPVNSSADQ
jgi:hypothetical protein